MDNNKMNFDPITGQPINQNINNLSNTNVTVTQEAQPTVQSAPVINSTQENSEQISNSNINQTVAPSEIQMQNTVVNMQKQMQNIPTVEQSKQEFIDNTQINNTTKNEEKNSNVNITFIVILFIIIFASIFFLFPYLNKVL